MTLYKLTDPEGYTQKGETGETLWKLGNTYTLPSKTDPHLCSPDVYHAYTNPNLALLLNPYHAHISDPVLWEVEGTIVAQDWGKVGCFEIAVVEKLDYPAWYQDETTRKDVAIMFAILCAEAVLGIFEEAYPEDTRPRLAIKATRDYLETTGTRAAVVAAAYAAYAAAYAAGAAGAAGTAGAAYAAYAAAYAADAAGTAGAAYAAYAADAAGAVIIDFGKLADAAVTEITQRKETK